MLPDSKTHFASHDDFASLRQEMIASQLVRRGIKDKQVLAAFAAVPRHKFVSEELAARAYDDVPLPIGNGQTISQPYMVAVMTELLQLKPTDRALEVGTGCGYQAAILSLLAAQIFTIERHPDLATKASNLMAQLAYINVSVHCADGTLGLSAEAPFDAILVAAASETVPPPLLAQLAEGGRLIMPVGDNENQELQLVERHDGLLLTSSRGLCRFVPLIGFHGWPEGEGR